MKKYLLMLGLFLFLCVSCKKDKVVVATPEITKTTFDSTEVGPFFSKYPDFKSFEEEIKLLYKKHDYHFIWYDYAGRIDFAEVLYNKANQMKNEGVITEIPYKKQIDVLFSEAQTGKADLNSELLISSLYFYYTKKVYAGVDPEKSKLLGWYLPREKVSYGNYLDDLIKDPNRIKKNGSEMISQYYKLKKALQFYRNIQNNGGWDSIFLPSKTILKVGDSATAITQIRKRLVLSGELSNSKMNLFDKDVLEAINKYQKKHNLQFTNTINASLVKHLNVSVEERIKTLIVNMERCRWIAPEIAEAKELIAVNIPSYKLQYLRNGKPVLTSNVVVGKTMHQTVIFSGQMSYIVFSPYWNVPRSIIEKEIKPGIAANKDYLQKHNMEWNNGSIRQKPGNANSLGLVKFMFPNSNNIYLHDTPAKSLFNKESRAFSHGCVRVEKARELAIKILENDKNWSSEKIDAAMQTGKERSYSLKRKIPVYIAYFTAWADEKGDVGFYEDIYNRDNRLAHLLYNDEK